MPDRQFRDRSPLGDVVIVKNPGERTVDASDGHDGRKPVLGRLKGRERAPNRTAASHGAPAPLVRRPRPHPLG
ncbi:hypothetical protein [Streptomyces europaeiscabiei]|uniref:hypothetical protein n=1 Tax=Streptomyces europaeiscabiei TaxID=146819 RepID=UPI002E285A28|nr:hypothetical protein [Streptomyces europaeiscabiei]